jgi:aldehyde:ferredoxin oxidoreductase
MRKEYYRSFGWDEDGIPSEAILKKLSVISIVNSL